MSDTTVVPTPTTHPAPQAISALENEPDSPEDDDNLNDPDIVLATEFFKSQETPTASDPGETPVPASSDPALQPVTPTPAAQEVTPAQTPVAAPAPAPVAPVAVQPEAAPTPSVQTEPQMQTPQASAPNAPEDTFRVLSETIARERPKIIEAVAAGQYQLTNEELTLVATEPEKVLPTLMARVHINAVQGVLTHVAQQLPAVVGGMIKAQQQQADLENRFYSAWPQLDRVKHDGTVRQLAAAYRQMNPNASFDDCVRIVGAQAAVALGVTTTPTGTPAPAVASVPVRQVPFAPAAAARTAAPTPTAEPGTWERMAAIIAADDAGEFNSE